MVKSLTLLALDGNPLPTIPAAAFNHLNNTLRGLSVGKYYSFICKYVLIYHYKTNFEMIRNELL